MRIRQAAAASHLALLGALLALTFAGCAADSRESAVRCGISGSTVEQMICSDPTLAARDRRMADVYSRSLEKLGTTANAADAIRDLKAYQRGWASGRDDCWKSADERQCIEESYARRTAELEARYGLVEARESVDFDCSDGSHIRATFVPTERPSVRLERDGALEIGLLARAASGAKYEAPFGIVFWTQGDEAMVEWPEGTEFRCRLVSQ